MIGDPQWFKPKLRGWSLFPICRQGWVYVAVWAAVVLLPLLALIGRGQGVEACLWLAASLGVLIWDARQILGEITPSRR